MYAKKINKPTNKPVKVYYPRQLKGVRSGRYMNPARYGNLGPVEYWSIGDSPYAKASAADHNAGNPRKFVRKKLNWDD